MQNLVPTIKRKQVKKACQHCRRSHTSCEDKRPCKRCIKLGLEDTCVDAVTKKRGRKRIRDSAGTKKQRKKKKTEESVLDQLIQVTDEKCAENQDEDNLGLLDEEDGKNVMLELLRLQAIIQEQSKLVSIENYATPLT